MLPLIFFIFIACHLCFPLLAQGSSDGAAGSGGGVYGGRHSYSLSTFSPSGDIDQVVRAMRASMLGVPIVALSASSIDATTSATPDASKSVGREIELPSSVAARPTDQKPSQGGAIYISIPLRFLATSPFLIDDGTPRIVQVTTSVCVFHTGVGADGRAMCDTALKLALDYRCVYGEEISLEELLEGLSEKVQEMTMRAGSRPSGCALMLGYIGSGGRDGDGPTLYRVDPSGAVVLLNSSNSRDVPGEDRDHTQIIDGSGCRRSVAFLGNWDKLRQKKDAFRSHLESTQFTTEDELQRMLIKVAQQTYVDSSSPINEGNYSPSSLEKKGKRPVLCASFTRERGVQISRIMRSI